MAENVLKKIIEKKSEKIENLKKTISPDSLNELINSNRIFIDFKENFQKKTRLIEDLKILISNDLKLEEKENIFKNIRRKWINIGKVPSHLAFNLNNSLS